MLSFFKEVKQEGKKITWIGRRDVITSTIMVLVMVTLVALFFLLVDGVLYAAIQALLGFRG
jgi:preprotein translocase subunit SecE